MCGFVTTLSGDSWVGYPTCVLTTVGGRAATFLFGAWFDLVGGQVDIHIRVCMNLPQERERL